MNQLRLFLLAAAVLALPGLTRADESFAKAAEEVNGKLVKLFGAGGFRGVSSYGTGILVSDEGHILTVATQMLETQDLRVHLPSGERYHAQIVSVEPDLDLALLKIKEQGVKTPNYFDIAAEASKPMAEPGTGVLAFSNQFNIATRGEPMSVQRGVIAAYSKLRGRRGIFEAPYDGDVYFVDAITNNPGAGGGALTSRDGKQLLGIIGKELKNTLSETWINYAVPVQATLTIQGDKEAKTVSVVDFVKKGIRGQGTVKAIGSRKEKTGGKGGYTGIVLVPNVVERTPPFVEELVPNSPAAKAGLKPDDLIVYVNGEQVVSIKEFKELMDNFGPADKVRLEVRRGDRLTTLELTLEEDPYKKKKP